MVSGLEIRNQLTLRRIMRELPLLTKKTSLTAGFCHLEGYPLVRLYFALYYQDALYLKKPISYCSNGLLCENKKMGLTRWSAHFCIGMRHVPAEAVTYEFDV